MKVGEVVEALENQVDAVSDYIIAVDKLMSGPPAPIRGNKLAALVSTLQESLTPSRAVIDKAKGS